MTLNKKIFQFYKKQLKTEKKINILPQQNMFHNMNMSAQQKPK